MFLQLMLQRGSHCGDPLALASFAALLLWLGVVVWAETPVVRVYSKGLSSCGGAGANGSSAAETPMELRNMSWSMPQPNAFQMAGTLVAKRDIHSPIFGMVAISKCDSTGEMCMNVLTHSIMDLCDDLRRNNTLLNDFASHIQGFPLKCPIPEGEYHLPPFKFSVNKDTQCGDLGGDWKMLLKLLVPGNETLMCHNWRTTMEVDC